MDETLTLSQDEQRLILELLEEERRELPPEIRRTDEPQYHDELLARIKTVDNLIKRLRAVPVKA